MVSVFQPHGYNNVDNKNDKGKTSARDINHRIHMY